MDLAARLQDVVGKRVSLQLSNNGYASGTLMTFFDDGEIELTDTRAVDGKIQTEKTYIRSYKDVVAISVIQ